MLQTMRRYISLAMHVPLTEAAYKARQVLRGRVRRRRAAKHTTFLVDCPVQAGKMFSCFRPLSPSVLLPHKKLIDDLAQNYLHHRFDVLGSGWEHIRYGMLCRGQGGHVYSDGISNRWTHPEERVNASNVAESARIRAMLDEGYTPIDWHVDCKSGYRWKENEWHSDIRYGENPGADIKVPWEISRMQHLPQLALAYALASTGEKKFRRDRENRGNVAPADVYAAEFRNQVLDFMAANPPGFGVNWASNMDVAIRISNWLAAYDLFTVHAARFDSKFVRLLMRSTYEHGEHIINNLEFSFVFRGNHYLANIVGLLFVSAYLPRTPETDSWLAFAVNELISEVENQFLPDGLNFEGSVSYHRLSLEMALYGTALVWGLPVEKLAALRECTATPHGIRHALKHRHTLFNPLFFSGGKTPFPDTYIQRLNEAVRATSGVLKTGGHAPQIGDNDNGRFFKMHPIYRYLEASQATGLYSNLKGYTDLAAGSEYLMEDPLDHRHLFQAYTGLVKGRIEPGESESYESEIVCGLAGRATLPLSEELRSAALAGYRNESRRGAAVPDLNRELSVRGFSHFGFYVFRSSRLYLNVRCGSNGQNGRGGHCHNDQLSFELSIDDCPLVVDPGTYCYTSSIEKRNLFRSTAMHNTLALGIKEQNSWEPGLAGVFRLEDQAKPELLELNVDRLLGRHAGFGIPHSRSIHILRHEIRGVDEVNSSTEKQIYFHLHPAVKVMRVHPQEGIVITSKSLEIAFSGGPGRWLCRPGLYSPGYGILMNTSTLCLESTATAVHWSISVSSGSRI